MYLFYGNRKYDLKTQRRLVKGCLLADVSGMNYDLPT